MREQFKMTVVISPLRINDGSETLEIDLVAHAKGEINEVFIVEIKSKLREDDFEQLYDHVRRFPVFFPEHRGKEYYGVLAAIEIPPDLRTKARKEGFYLATIKDEVFEIAPPDDFVPHAYGLRSLS